MIIDEETLEHFGTKGMKWGVRKSKDTGSSRSPQQQRVADERAKVAKRAAVSVGLGLTAAAILFAGNKYLYTGGGSNARQVGKLATEGILKKSGSIPASAVKAPSAASIRMSAEHTAFMKQFAEKQNVINKAANADLRSGYERGMTPLPLREYLPDWA